MFPIHVMMTEGGVRCLAKRSISYCKKEILPGATPPGLMSATNDSHRPEAVSLREDDTDHRPPPAQAQAHPAQAQAHAQERPPPPYRPPREPLEGGGGGLVTLVTRLVKSVTLPIVLWDRVCMPAAMEAAKSEPGRRGTEGIPWEEDGEEEEVLEGGMGRKVGS